MGALRKYIELHNSDPSKVRVRGRRELDVKESITKVNADGELFFRDYSFIELWAWRKEHPNVEPDKIVKRKIHGIVKEGVLVAQGKAGHHTLRDYADEKAERTLHLHDKDDEVFDDGTLDRKYDAAQTSACSTTLGKDALSSEDYLAIINASGASETAIEDEKSSSSDSSESVGGFDIMPCAKLGKKGAVAPAAPKAPKPKSKQPGTAPAAAAAAASSGGLTILNKPKTKGLSKTSMLQLAKSIGSSDGGAALKSIGSSDGGAALSDQQCEALLREPGMVTKPSKADVPVTTRIDGRSGRLITSLQTALTELQPKWEEVGQRFSELRDERPPGTIQGQSKNDPKHHNRHISNKA
eukprot:280239-Amphidinium_carterae.1